MGRSVHEGITVCRGAESKSSSEERIKKEVSESENRTRRDTFLLGAAWIEGLIPV